MPGGEPLQVMVCSTGAAGLSGVRRAVRLANRRAAAGRRLRLLLDPRLVRDTVGIDPGVRVVELADPDPGNRYLCREQADADRVFETLLAHGWQSQPVTLTFVGCAALALTVVRARRLLGLFRDATIETVDLEPLTGTVAGTPSEVFARWAAGYVRRYAGTVLRADGTPLSRVSVVIPLFDHEQRVHEAVASVRRDLPEAEIVVVNDGSADLATNRLFDGLSGVVKVSQESQGLSAARNAGIRHGHGDYVVPLDADDTIRPGFLDAARRALDGNADLAYLVGYTQYTGPRHTTYAPAGFIPELSLFMHTHGRATGMYRKEVLQGVGGYDRRFPTSEDWEIQIALYRAGHLTDVLPIVAHRSQGDADRVQSALDERIRHRPVQQIMRKHLPMLDAGDLRVGMLVLAHLWDTEYEPCLPSPPWRSLPV
ncbi:glycosyltransferase family 2 protein [Streptosporangium saharense]|uniref:glycosyltransferase family 2 protein n=1 Tax=Streptosporangium saharense TaxID=1706840 RepID=UPI0036BB919F